MTLSEFKAWFEGFTESIEGKSAPTQKQWAKIKEKVAQIDGAPVTQTIYLDRWGRPHYWDYLRPYWVSTSGWATSSGGHATGGSAAGFDSHAAMHALGRAEALN
jgi:hypothetical protein